MNPADFSDAALVVLGHGTTLDQESSRPVYQHAAELRGRRLFAAVREAFWKQPPQVRDVLAELSAARVFVAPLFISEGYFSDRVIPQELGFGAAGESARVQKRERQTFYYCRPAGTHESMTRVLLARARGVLAQFPFPRAPQLQEVTLFIAAHGTERDTNSRAAAERQAQLVRALGLFAAVHAVFMEEEPRIAKCYDMAETRAVVVVPYFVSDGLHVRQDIPGLLGEPERVVKQRLQNGQPAWRNPSEKSGKLVWYSPAVGTEPLVAEVLLERVREAACA